MERRTFIKLGLAAVTPACLKPRKGSLAGADIGNYADAAFDALHDTGVDVGAFDASPDTGVDQGTFDASPDTGVDLGTDTVGDLDIGPDVASDIPAVQRILRVKIANLVSQVAIPAGARDVHLFNIELIAEGGDVSVDEIMLIKEGISLEIGKRIAGGKNLDFLDGNKVRLNLGTNAGAAYIEEGDTLIVPF